MVSMAMNLLAADETLLPALRAGESRAAQALLPVFQRLETIIQNGYTDYALNCTYPEDNYDGSILAFFAGSVPFYVCNAECVSGMQKRESKSEAFSAAPFDYTFCYAPLGDEGVYAYQEPWYGFSINRNSDETELSAEFLRFMLPHLDEMASRKGLPTVIRDSGGDPRYQALRDVAPIQSESCSDSSIPEAVRGAVAQVCCDFGAGVYQSAEEAAQAFVQLCRELLA